MAHVLLDENFLRYEEEPDAYLEAFRALGIEHSLANLNKAITSSISLPAEGSFCMGSIPFIRQMQRQPPAGGPGMTFFSPDLHYYSRYHPVLPGNQWLNSDYVMVTFSEFLRRLDDWPRILGASRFVLKPDFGLKAFEVSVMSADRDHPDIGYLTKKVDPKALCILAKEQAIDSEYRFVVERGEGVIAGSRYMKDGQIDLSPLSEIPRVALSLAGAASQCDIPEELVVVDVAILFSGEPRFIEMNCLSTSGMYFCNKRDVFAAVKRVLFD